MGPELSPWLTDLVMLRRMPPCTSVAPSAARPTRATRRTFWLRATLLTPAPTLWNRDAFGLVCVARRARNCGLANPPALPTVVDTADPELANRPLRSRL